LNPCHAKKLKSLKQCQEGIMKLALLCTTGINKNFRCLAVAGASVIFLLVVGPAAADPYKWCAAYRNGSNNCGFTTIEQCRASVSGVGGSCVPNQFYTGPDKTTAQRPQRQVQRKPPPERRVQEHRAQERRATEAPASERRGSEDRFQ
jgi:hypothetical protein